MTRTLKAAPTTSATLIAAGQSNRKGLVLTNYGTVTVFLDFHPGVSTTTGYPLDPGQDYNDESTQEPVYGITALGTGDIRGIEIVA